MEGCEPAETPGEPYVSGHFSKGELKELDLIRCRRDNNLHMEPAYSAQFRGLESAIKVSPNTTFFYPIKLENYTRRIKSRFSEVLRTSPYPSQKIQLILTILTVVSLFPYMLQ